MRKVKQLLYFREIPILSVKVYNNHSLSEMMLEFIRSITSFLKRNGGRLAIVAVIALVAAIFHVYVTKSSLAPRAVEQGNVGPKRKKQADIKSISSRAGLKARLLLNTRREFSSYCQMLIPILKKRVAEAIDITSSIRKLKQIRASSGADEEIKAQLWNDVKNASFTALFVAVYELCAVTTLLRIQLHVIARACLVGKPIGESIGSRDSDPTVFRELIEGTFRPLFGTNMQHFSSLVRQKVEVAMVSWTVSDRLRVEFDELRDLIFVIRRTLEPTVFDSLVRPIFAENNDQAQSSQAQYLLDQLWDIVDSPIFVVVFTEALDDVFRVVVDQLHRGVFVEKDMQSGSHENGGGSSSHAVASFTPMALRAQRSPPFASVLPQVRAIVSKLLPEMGELGPGLKSLSAGPLLDSLCINILDAEER